ncbi:hypothetical protein EJ05DRAFT_506868 [Pseudovirgaria hyperparasitica]|uniref:Aminoglycoside phosphotransferase domain-containing protein n=1 Tax=Pseudovirgaria hyperparasitica TaxID=470096 RepID=A0A6A6WM70_9PEZI|nr:uncharacterized protein EJ05DRAFT_506868 [Pseudovirgaria hyperparasitica]KAF2763253.1 hypothetical protein EJ05DRAFT_506868 [Pseudovirgaria hyperparasitica]
MSTNHNHMGYQARIDFVQSLLREELGVNSDAEITPILYDPEFPFRYNNFVYRITLCEPTSSDQGRKYGVSHRPGCVSIPDGTKNLIVRLANPNAEGMHHETRIENEVAIISLAASALRDFQPHVVPSIYAWGSAAAKSSFGWTIQELMPGTSLDELFPSMELPQKREVFAQMARLLKGLQDYQLPETITAFGGVTFDKDGKIVSAVMPTVGKGPWPSYEASFRGRIEEEFREVDENPHVQGWRGEGIRDRLDAFVERGLSAQFESLETKQDKSIVHADFNPSNLLIDPSTLRITGLIDYDFSSILHPSYEYLRSFLGAGGQFRGWCGEEGGEQAALTEARLHGFPSPLPQSTENGVDWEAARVLDEELEKLDVRRPKTIKGIEKVADVDTILRTIVPWRLSNPDILQRQSEEVIKKCRRENEEQLKRLLDYLGF